MQAPARRRLTVIPADRSKKRQKGNPKPMVAFRNPSDLKAYFEKVLGPNDDRSDLIIRMLRISRDTAATMGDAWWDVEREANLRHKSIGEVLGELALAALVATRKARK